MDQRSDRAEWVARWMNGIRTPEDRALALVDQASPRHPLTIFTYFASDPAAGGVVAIGTQMPVIVGKSLP